MKKAEEQRPVSDAEFQELLEKARARGEGENGEAGAQEASVEPVKLVPWRDSERAVPTAIVRSALFGVVKPGRRSYLKGELLASWKGCEIRYTGQKLNQYDQDIWMQALHFARKQDLSAENGIRFTLRGFAKAIGGSYNGRGARCVSNSFERMRATALSVRMNSFVYVGGLVDSFAADEAAGLYVVRIDTGIAGLFGTGYTKIEAEIRRRLSTQIARYLYGYIQSHKATQQSPHRIGLARLQALMGSESGLKKFRWNVRRAMEELQRLGIVASWRITENDALEFVRPRYRRIA